MGYINLKLEGANNINQMLGHVENIPGLAKQALQAGADVLLPHLKEAAPIGPGGGVHIHDRIAARVKGRTIFVGVWDEPIAYYVEYGHGGPHPAPPHHYLAPAADAYGDEAIQAIADAVEAYLNGA